MGPLLVEVRSVLFTVMYLLLRRLVRLLANSSKDLKGDVEVVVLRHQLMIQAPRGRPRLRRRDLLFMAPMSRTLPRFDGPRSWSAHRRSFAGIGSR